MNLYTEILAALETEERVMLTTVISTSGSTPASALSKMLIKNGGTTSVGTISGGSMEGKVLTEARQLFISGKSIIRSFHLQEGESVPGSICGGNLDVLIETLNRFHIPVFQKLKNVQDNGEGCILATYLLTDGLLKSKTVIAEQNKNGIIWNVEHLDECDKIFQQSNDLTIRSSAKESITRAFNHNTTIRITLPDGELIFEPVQGTPELLLFGGGHVSKSICRNAASAGFRVTVVDDRAEFADPLQFPEAERTLHHEFLRPFKNIDIKSSTYIVIVTRGHQYDEEILENALGTSAGYIGMIGSRRKIESAFQRLQRKGFSSEQLRRVYAPIGLEIGAITPEEIGISVTAQIIRVRRGLSSPVYDKSKIMTSFFEKNDVLS